jgi:hypothetical protein
VSSKHSVFCCAIRLAAANHCYYVVYLAVLYGCKLFPARKEYATNPIELRLHSPTLLEDKSATDYLLVRTPVVGMDSLCLYKDGIVLIRSFHCDALGKASQLLARDCM